MSDLTDLYQSVILDHNKRPRNRGRIPTANRVATGDNPTCGDNCTVYMKVVDGRANEISFEGSGCAISQASASLMTTLVKGKTEEEVKATYEEFADIVKTGNMPEDFNELAAFAGVHAFPARIKCATLSWHAALEAFKQPDSSVTSETP